MAIDQQLARFAQPLIRWREREGSSSSKQEKRGLGGGGRSWRKGEEGGVRFTQAVSELPLSVEGTNEWRWREREGGEVVVVVVGERGEGEEGYLIKEGTSSN